MTLLQVGASHIEQRRLAGPVALGQQAGGLVHDQQVIVLVQDVQDGRHRGNLAATPRPAKIPLADGAAEVLESATMLDGLRFQHFAIGWASTSDYGSSDDPEMFTDLHAYNPYHNLRPGTDYPAMLATTADHDDRVVPGHGAGKPTDMVIDEYADRFAFLTRTLGLESGWKQWS